MTTVTEFLASTRFEFGLDIIFRGLAVHAADG
jgi:hypothetical protein